MTTFTLPTTATYPKEGDRKASYWPDAEQSAGGTLVITQGRKRAAYRVEEDTAEHFPARTWLVAKEDSDDGEVYGVTLDPRGWRCTCKGFVCHHGVYRCQHTDSLRAVFEAGQLDPVPAAVAG